MGRMKDQAIGVNPLDEAFTAGFEAGRGTAGDNGSGFEAPGIDATLVPLCVVVDLTLSRDARLLYVILDGYSSFHDSFEVEIETLAADMGSSARSVRRWLDELRDRGLVTTRQTGRSLVFIVHDPHR